MLYIQFWETANQIKSSQILAFKISPAELPVNPNTGHLFHIHTPPPPGKDDML